MYMQQDRSRYIRESGSVKDSLPYRPCSQGWAPGVLPLYIFYCMVFCLDLGGVLRFFLFLLAFFSARMYTHVISVCFKCFVVLILWITRIW